VILATDPTYFWLTGGWWDAIGAVATSVAVIVGGGAAWAAVRQLGQSKQARLDQARPYVLVTVEPSAADQHILEIVIRNVGAGPAKNVRMSVDPPLKRVEEHADFELASARIFNESIDMLPPGFELKVFFDSTIDRYETKDKMPEQHTVTLNYEDSLGHPFVDENCVLDLSLYDGLVYTEVFGVHHVAKALREIAPVLKSSPMLKGKVDIRAETRSQAIERVAKEMAERRRQHDELVARLKASHPELSAGIGVETQPPPDEEDDA
jgi:hypothetical protein